MPRAPLLLAALLVASCRPRAPASAGDQEPPDALVSLLPESAADLAAEPAPRPLEPDAATDAATETIVEPATPTDPLTAAIAIDLHADVVYQLVDHGRDPATGDGQWTVERARRGGLDAQIFPLWVPSRDEDQAGSLKRHARAFREMVEASGGALALVRTAAEIRARADAGGIGALLAIEGAQPLGDDPAHLDAYVEQGLRCLGLTWNQSNAFAESAAEPRTPHGLTDAGRALVRRANDAGVLLDLAHASAETFWDTYRLSRTPLLVSHTGLRARRDLPRNIDDLQLLALARTGGVVGIVWHSPFLVELPEGETAAPLDALLAHYDHARAVGAVAALAIGTDLDGGIHPPQGLETVAELPALPAGLRAHGWSDDEIRGVLGETFLRLLDAADAAATTAESPRREWPATTKCSGLETAKDAARLTDRLIVPGPTLLGDFAFDVAWPEEPGATAAVLEVWGEPGASFELRTAGDSSGDAALGMIALDERGNGRLELPDDPVRARRLVLVSASSARLDEIAIWLR
jgi:membrane dipeptidase